jgi:hypothetical protein
LPILTQGPRPFRPSTCIKGLRVWGPSRFLTAPGYREEQKARRRAACDPEYAATHPLPERREPTIVDYRTAIKNKYRSGPYAPPGRDGDTRSPEQQFKDAFMEEFLKPY